MFENVELILLISILFYLLILVYDFSILINVRLYKVTDKVRKTKLIRAIKKSKDKKCYKYLKNTENLKALEELIEEEYTIDDNKIINIINNDKYNYIYEKLCPIYSKKDVIDKSYFAYILSFIKYNSIIIDNYLLKVVSEKSIYCIENSLYSMYCNGNVNLIKEAYKVLTNNDSFYTNKLITDGLINFKGDVDLLCNTLYKNFRSYNIEIRIGIINYYRNIKFDVTEKIYNELNTNKKLDKELEISYIRYFSKMKYDRAYELFIKRLSTNYYDDFEYDVVMIQALANYRDIKAEKMLEKKLEDSNYYIRLNAGKTLKKISDITKIKSDDKFANDMLRYLIEIG